MPYNFAADSFRAKKKLCNRLSSKVIHVSTKKRSFCVFSRPLGDLEATYAVHLRLIGKSVMFFLLMIIKLFC